MRGFVWEGVVGGIVKGGRVYCCVSMVWLSEEWTEGVVAWRRSGRGRRRSWLALA